MYSGILNRRVTGDIGVSQVDSLPAHNTGHASLLPDYTFNLLSNELTSTQKVEQKKLNMTTSPAQRLDYSLVQ